MYKVKIKNQNLSLLIVFILLHLPACATLSESGTQSMTSPVDMTLNFYQRYISPVDGQRCQMYPSCSSYSRQAFKKHGFIKGWILTCDRLLRCGRNEMTISPKIMKNGMAYCDDSLKNNDFWWYADDNFQGNN